MSHLFEMKLTEIGARPGTLVVDQHAEPPRIHTYRYTPVEIIENDVDSVQQIQQELENEGIVWIDIQGLGDEKLIRAIGDLFSIHILALEDIVNVPQRPKTEVYEQHQLFISRMVKINQQGNLDVEQISLFFGDGFVLTFQERPGDVLDAVRKRLRSPRAPIRGHGADYLAYAIIDTIIDGFYPVLEYYGEQLEVLEAMVVANAIPAMLDRINQTKRNLLILRRGIWPQRDAINTMIRDASPFIKEETKVFLRDSHDHCIQVADILETFRETAGALLSTYLSAIGNKQNEVMRILTIVSSLFIPLTFLAGIYGMNFENMPELKSRYAYPILLLVMFLAALGMVFYFKFLGWIGRSQTNQFHLKPNSTSKEDF